MRNMSHPNAATTAAANILATRRRAGEQGPRLPESCRPLDIETALSIQAAVTVQLGDVVGAWKCALPTADNVVLAPIYAATIHTAAPCPVWVRAGCVRVEPELPFILDRDLPPRDAPYTPADVDAAIAHTRLALELIDSRYVDPGAVSFAENLADGLLNQGLFLGPEVDTEQARATEVMTIEIANADSRTTQLDGRHPGLAPRAPLYWLAEFLRSRGGGLRAGQAVITGSYAGSIALPIDEDVTVRYGDLGALTVRFSPR